MLSISIVLCGIFFGILYSKQIKNGFKLLNIVKDTLVSKFFENKIPIILEDVKGKKVIKYGDIYLNTFEPMYSYDIKCLKMDEDKDLKNETRNFTPDNEEQNIIPLNLIKFKNFLGFISFTPKDYDSKNLHILIKKITEQEYSVYKFEQNSYVNVREIVGKYEEYLLNSKMENILAEAYD